MAEPVSQTSHQQRQVELFAFMQPQPERLITTLNEVIGDRPGKVIVVR